MNFLQKLERVISLPKGHKFRLEVIRKNLQS